MTEKEKLLAYIAHKGLSKRGFCDSVGVSSSFLESGSSFGIDKLREIKKVYPDLSLTWMVMDVGEMIESDDNALTSFMADNDEISTGNQELIYNGVKRLSELKSEIDLNSDSDKSELYRMADEYLKELAGLSKQYTNLVHFIRKSFKIK